MHHFVVLSANELGCLKAHSSFIAQKWMCFC